MPTDGRGILRGPSGGELTDGGARDKTWVLWSAERSLNLQALLLSFCSLVYPFCMLISVLHFLKMVPQANAVLFPVVPHLGQVLGLPCACPSAAVFCIVFLVVGQGGRMG